MNIVQEIISFISSVNYSDVITKVIAGIIVAILTGVFAILIRRIKLFFTLKKWRSNEESSKINEVADQRQLNLIKSHLYVPAMGQNDAPNDAEKIEASHNRFPLVNAILDNLYSKKSVIDKKRYLILSGSGMGKTAFSASLFLKHINRYKFKKNPHPIYVKYLGDKSILDDINNINDSKSSQAIIILDALDENHDASNDFIGFMTKLEEVTNKFRFVVITCRTHFFSKREQELSNSSNWINGVQKGYLSYEKIYISPFTEEETMRYLEAKYQLGSNNYIKAHKFIKSSHDLMVRPLILSFMDDFLRLKNLKNPTTIDIYATIVDSWFDREKKFLPSSCSRLMFWDFSKKIAFYLYNKWNDYNEWYITEEEFQKFMVENGYDNMYSFKVRSLINRRNDGSIKFCHRCFWEFFLAIYIMENPSVSLNPNGLDTVVSFLKDIYKSYLQGSTYDFICYYKLGFFKPCKVLDQDLYKELNEIYNNYNQTSILNDGPEKDRTINGLVYHYMETIMRRLPYIQPFTRLGALLYWILKLNKENTIALHSTQKQRLTELAETSGAKYGRIAEDITHKLLCTFSQEQSIRNTILSEVHDLFVAYHDWECCAVSSIRELREQNIQEIESFLNHLLAFNDYSIEECRIFLPYLLDFSKEQIESLLEGKKIIHIGYGFNDDTSVYHFLDLIEQWIKNYCERKLKEEHGVHTPSFIICIHRQSEDIDKTARFIKKLPFVDSQFIIKCKCNSKTLYYYEPNTHTPFQTERDPQPEEDIKANLMNILAAIDY